MNFKNQIKSMLKESAFICNTIRTWYKIFGGNRYRSSGKSNVVRMSECFQKKTKILIRGSNNSLIFDKGTKLTNCFINIYGDGNIIHVSRNCNLNECSFWIEDKNNTIEVGESTTVYGGTQIACIEGCKVVIGKDCMFSSDIMIRTGDSHSIIDDEGKRINISKDIYIGNHVWIGTRCILNKGVIISDNSIVGAGAIVTKAFTDKNIILVGNPAKIIKSNIGWIRERI